jgi:hypothetical protein
VEQVIGKSDADTKEAKDGHLEELDKRVVEEAEKVQALIEKVTTSETLIRADTPAKEALDEANRIRRKFDESVKRLAQYKAYQETLKLPITDIPEVEEFEQKFHLRNRLWTIRHTFADQQKRWYYENFLEQDAATICSTVKERESELLKLKAKLGRDVKDEVLEAATADVKNVSRHSNLIAALGNKSMQEKHW